MASQSRTRAREEERRLNVRTLAIASVASATAAVVTSQFWVAGTWMAAAFTPVLVTLISELLHRPTAVIAERFTTEGTRVMPRRAPAEREADPDPPVRVYRAGEDSARGERGTRSRRRIAVGVVAVTAVLAFAITAVAITGTELVTGGSIGKGDRNTTLFGGEGNASTDEERTTPESQDEPQDSEQQQPDQPDRQQGEQPTTPSDEGGAPAPDEEQPPPAETTTPAPAPQAPLAPEPDQP